MSRTLVVARLCLVPLLVLTMVGCSDADPQEGPEDPPSTTNAASPTETTPTEPAPPAGPTVEVLGASVTLPEGWRPEKGGTDIGQDATGPGEFSRIALDDLGPSADLGLRQLASQVLAPSSGIEDPTIAAGGTRADGAPVVLVEGEDTTGQRIVSLGTIRDAYAISVTFDLDPKEFSQAETDDLVDEVLAGFEWN